MAVMEIFADRLYDAVLDCLKVLPILFLAYLLVSFLSHDHSHKFSGFLAKNRKTSVLYAAFLGCVPQCGFSSVIADLYSEKKVSLGTLVAVFVATSDEAIPIMISNPDSIIDMLILIGVKIVFAIFWGYLVDLGRFFQVAKSNTLSMSKWFQMNRTVTNTSAVMCIATIANLTAGTNTVIAAQTTSSWTHLNTHSAL